MRPLLGAALAVMLMTGLASADAFGGGCCDHCGDSRGCQKVCRLVREEKKVEITCWGVKCEDFCIPGPSCRGCTHCEEVCEDCDAKAGVSSATKRFVWTEWIPGCATVHTKKKLMKRTITRKVPSYRWVVEDLCAGCEAGVEKVSVQPGDDVPPPPVVKAKVIAFDTEPVR